MSDNSSEEPASFDVEPIWLILTTKRFMTDQKHLKPRKILLPHSLHDSSDISICLITPEPQRQFKDAIAHPSFPTTLSKRITKVISTKKLEAKYRSFEAKRQLRDSYDLFLADDRIITYLAKILGKTFYKSTTKRPIPVSLSASKPKSKKNAAFPSAKLQKEISDTKSIVAPPLIAKEIERTLSTAQVNLSPSTTTAVRVGLASQMPEQLAANIEAVMASLTDTLVGCGNVRAVHIKGPNTMALPIWLTEELWIEGEMALDEEAAETKAKGSRKGKRKRTLTEGTDGSHADEEGGTKKADGINELANEPKHRKISTFEDHDLSHEMKERRERLRQQKKEAGEKVEENNVPLGRTSEEKPNVKKSRK